MVKKRQHARAQSIGKKMGAAAAGRKPFQIFPDRPKKRTSKQRRK